MPFIFKKDRNFQAKFSQKDECYRFINNENQEIKLPQKSEVSAEKNSFVCRHHLFFYWMHWNSVSYIKWIVHPKGKFAENLLTLKPSKM